jgi:hypothetical protein
MKITKLSQNKKLTKTAMPARLGEIDGIVHPMPVILSDEAKNNYPSFNEKKVLALVQGDPFLEFVYSEIGSGEESLRQIFNLFIVEDNNYCTQYNKGNWYREAQGRFDDIDDQYKKGRCFDNAGEYFSHNQHKGDILLVHGFIQQIIGPLSGVKMAHAWVEEGDKVISFDSNGGKVVNDKDSYYLFTGLLEFAMGQAEEPNEEMDEEIEDPSQQQRPNVQRRVKEDWLTKYTPEQAISEMLEHGHWGPWDERFSTYTV